MFIIMLSYFYRLNALFSEEKDYFVIDKKDSK